MIDAGVGERERKAFAQACAISRRCYLTRLGTREREEERERAESD